MTPRSCTRLLCRSCLHGAGGLRAGFGGEGRAPIVPKGQRGPPSSARTDGGVLCPPPRPHSRHHGRLRQKGLRCGVIFNALHGDFVPPVIPQHHVCGPGETGTGGSGKHPGFPGPSITLGAGGCRRHPPPPPLGPPRCWGHRAHLRTPLCQ